ncbi:hypothetical protein TNCV_3729501 [Trichonephila clavipes]|nr:hypothetical protein TNCV_3729501 [Trichonephila clavipes]
MLGMAKVVFSILLSGMTVIGRTMEFGRRGYDASSGRRKHTSAGRSSALPSTSVFFRLQRHSIEVVGATALQGPRTSNDLNELKWNHTSERDCGESRT